MKIAVCDDEEEFNKRTVKLIRSMLKKTEDYKITICASGEELLETYRREPFDIIFLDIEMEGMNGMDTARQLREKDENVIIVFLTSYEEFALEGYEVNAYRYLIKKQPEYVYKKQFKSIFQEYFQKHKYFVISDRNNIARIYLKDICFFEVLNKKIIVHTMTNTYEYTGKLSEVESQLADDASFIRSHKSYIINIAQVDTIGNTDITMKNTENVRMSRKRKKDVVERYLSYMTGR